MVSTRLSAAFMTKLRVLILLPFWDWILAGITATVAFLVFAFGRNSVGFIALISIFCLVEMVAAMVVAGLDDKKVFGWRQFVRFWLMKTLLLMVPLLGAGVDWAWYLMSGPEAFLVQDVRRVATKAMLIGVLAFQFREVGRCILFIYKDLPFLKMLMHQVDKLMRAGEEPPYRRREYDLPYSEQLDEQEIHQPIQEH